MTPRLRFPIAALAAGALLLLAACGQNDTKTGASAPRTANGEVVLNRGNGAEPKTLDPHIAQGSWEDQIIGDLLVGLTTQDARGKPIPGVAERWETSADGLTWTFHLRDSQWSDGTPLTAEDFVFGWRRILDPNTASQYAYFLYIIKNAEAINTGKMPGTALGISAPDPKTVVVQLVHPAPYLPEFMMHYTTYALPRHVVEAKGKDWVKPGTYVGNGPYTLVEWVPNDHITLVKNPRFYDAADVKIDKIVYHPSSDYEAAFRRFRAGELDLQERLPPLEIDWIKANMPEILHLDPISVNEYFTVNQSRKPLNDIRLREALSLALDRETIVGTIQKLGEPPAYSYVPPSTANFPGGNALPFKGTPYPERVKQAQALMRQAGYGPGNPLKTTLLLRSASADPRRIAAAVQQMWRAIYVDLQIVQTDVAVFYDKVQQHDFDIAQAGWVADFDDASTFLDLLRTGNPNNYGLYKNPAYDALLDKANQQVDVEARGELLKQAEATAMKDHAWIPLYFWVSHAITHPYVKNWLPTANDIRRTRWLSLDPH